MSWFATVEEVEEARKELDDVVALSRPSDRGKTALGGCAVKLVSVTLGLCSGIFGVTLAVLFHELLGQNLGGFGGILSFGVFVVAWLGTTIPISWLGNRMQLAIYARAKRRALGTPTLRGVSGTSGAVAPSLSARTGAGEE
jgi:hypothetical protein